MLSRMLTEEGATDVLAPKTLRTLQRNFEGYLFISPWLIGYLVFVFGAVVASLYISFTEWPLLRSPRFIGFENYVAMINDPLFWQSLKVTSIYLLSLPLRLAAGLGIAVLLNQKIAGMSIYRTVYYMPSVVTGVSVALMWIWVFNSRYGLLNSFLRMAGIDGPRWLGQEAWVMPAFIIMSLWEVGGAMLIYLGGLQGVPTSLYESAVIDGANAWRRFWSVTVPMISPVILFNLVMGMLASFQVFTSAFIMTQGGPNYASLFYVLYLYKNAFEYFRMGYASALAWVLFVLILLTTLLIFRTSGRWVFYAGRRAR